MNFNRLFILSTMTQILERLFLDLVPRQLTSTFFFSIQHFVAKKHDTVVMLQPIPKIRHLVIISELANSKERTTFFTIDEIMMKLQNLRGVLPLCFILETSSV